MALAFLTGVTFLCSVSARAQSGDSGQEPPEIPRYSDSYTGVHTGFGAVAGPTLIGNDELEDTLGLMLGTEIQFGLVLHAVIFNIDYLHAFTTAELGGSPLDVVTDGISLSVSVNPIFVMGNLALLFGGGIWRLVSGLYVQAGIGLVRTDYAGAGVDIEEDWALGNHWGAGLDVPIGSPDHGAVWVGFQYRLSFYPSSLPDLEAAEESLAQHAFLLSVAYRVNALPL